MENIDLLIVGAGPVGCVVAERAANVHGWNSLIVEKRNHIAGNCYDTFHESGILYHKYGPHYFRTNNEKLFQYLSNYTEWIEGDYYVKCSTRGQLFPFPINLITLSQFYNRKFTPNEAREFLKKKSVHNNNPLNSEEFVLSKVGEELYKSFYLGYTMKQWDKHPRELSPSVCGRIPIRFNNDERYVDHRFQFTPKYGFTKMFENMIDNPKIKLLLQCDYKVVNNFIRPKIATIYSGPVDEYFDFVEGKLLWRSLDFKYKKYKKEFVQPCVQINYPNDFSYTRSVEIKHVTKQLHHHTLVSYEYPHSNGDPYYPIPDVENENLYKKYADLCLKETELKNVYFCGRLAQYKYVNTDQAIEMALDTFEKIKF